MKKYFICVAMALLALGCTKPYDDSGIRTEIEGIKYRLDELETNVASIRTTLGDARFVQKVEKYVDPDTGRITGVTVTYTTGEVVHFSIETVTPYAGPVLSVMKNGAGELCWAIDGVIVQLDGQDVTIYHKPDFAVGEDGHLYVTVDGETIDLGDVRGPKGEDGTVPVQDGIIKGLEVTDEAVIITYDNGSVTIPLATSFQLVIDPTEFMVTSTDPIEIPYTVKNKTENTVVDVYHGNDFRTEVLADKIVVTPKKADAEGLMLAYADSKSGLTSIVKLSFEGETFEITDSPADAEAGIDYLVEAEGGTVEANAVSNITFDVQPQAEWIHFVKTRAQSYVIELSVDENKEPSVRVGTVNIVKAGTEEVVQTITIGQKAAEAGAKNLSKNGPANCYIVTSAGDYKFWAVKGNSSEAVAAASVEVLWETWNDKETVTPNSVIASVSLEGNYVAFSTPATLKPGNAVIAAKDGEGTILWSWHIWVPATPVTVIDDPEFYTSPLMDRNLGALNAPDKGNITMDAYGFGYQWGRKDPFPGSATYAGTEISEKSASADIDVAYTVRHPNVWVRGKEDAGLGNWNSTVIPELWNSESGNKTIYDPCPPGYRVPVRDSGTPWWKSDSQTGWAEGTACFTYTSSTHEIVFPLGGYLEGNGPTGYYKEKERTIVWSAKSKSDSEADKGYGAYLRTAKGYYSSGYYKYVGGAVRCVVTDEVPVIPPEPQESAVDLSKKATANCYVVTAAGDYKFKAVKGNSAESVGTVASAELLWETDNTATAPEVNAIIAKVGVEDGYITFSTPETLKSGNALIAAKDASDVILWSWHIWIPATDVVTQDAEAFCGYKMMDRNLGALVVTNKEGDVDPLSIGCYFEWGRKDPFPGSTNFDKNPTPAAVAGTSWSNTDGLVTMEFTIQNPTVFASEHNKDDSKWFSEDPTNFWNTAEGKKTIYDPCPAGYRVPVVDDSKPM